MNMNTWDIWIAKKNTNWKKISK